MLFLNMQLNWIYVIAVVAMVLVAILLALDKLSETNFMQIFMFILGAIFGSAAGFVYAYNKFVR